MTEQLNPQTIIDELIKRVNSLTIENVVLSVRLQEMSELANSLNHSHEDSVNHSHEDSVNHSQDEDLVAVIGESTEE